MQGDLFIEEWPKVHRLEIANVKFKALTGQDVNFLTFQTEVDRVHLLVFLSRHSWIINPLMSFSDKEQEQADIDAEDAIANTNLQKADSNLSHLKMQLNQKKTELKSGSSSTISSPTHANPSQTWNARWKEDLTIIRP